MKKIISTLALIAITLGLFAQTGLFGISYGQERSDVENQLKVKGFVVKETTKGKTELTNSKIEYLDYLSVFFNSESKVSSWMAVYAPEDGADFFNDMEDTLEDMHDEGEYLDWFYTAWPLGSDKAVYLGLDESSSPRVIVSYSDDEDLMYYYYDSYW